MLLQPHYIVAYMCLVQRSLHLIFSLRGGNGQLISFHSPWRKWCTISKKSVMQAVSMINGLLLKGLLVNVYQ